MAKKTEKNALNSPRADEQATPLTSAEITELETLETGCLNQEPFPYPDQMRRLENLRERFTGEILVLRCTNGACRKDFAVTEGRAGLVCPHCRKQVQPQPSGKRL